jgi:hypothetical protein
VSIERAVQQLGQLPLADEQDVGRGDWAQLVDIARPANPQATASL